MKKPPRTFRSNTPLILPWLPGPVSSFTEGQDGVESITVLPVGVTVSFADGHVLTVTVGGVTWT